MNILIIEDDTTVASFMRHKLENNIPESKIRVAYDLAAAKIAASEFQPDVISLDLNLQPGQDFEVVCNEIPYFSQFAPVVVVSGIIYYDPSFREKVLAKGAVDCIDKNLMTSQFYVDAIKYAAKK